MPEVSVVIPVYNSENYLSECLGSILSQTYADMEVLCVDDGSTDRSLDLLNNYAKRDKRIQVFTRENDGKGAATARNLGMDHASGAYIMFLDSDDFFEPEMIEMLVERAEETDAQLVICGANRFDHKRERLLRNYPHIHLDRAPKKQPFSWQDCPEHIFQIGDILAWNKLYRRDFLERENLYFEPIPISDDQMIPALSMAFAERIATVDRNLINYRINTGSSQVDRQAQHPQSAYLATYKIVQRMKEKGIYEFVKRSYLNTSILLMREYFDKMHSVNTFSFLYDIYRNEIFPMLGAEELPINYFYDKRLGEWYKLITENSLEEILFRSSRAYGAAWTTAILRFPVPYDRIRKGSRIVLVKKGLVGRYWYAQILLSGYCEVVAWIDEVSELPEGLKYDEILTAE